MTTQTSKMQIGDIKDELLVRWDKLFMTSKKIDLAEGRWAMLSACIPNPIDTRHDPFLIATLKCGWGNRIHLLARDVGAYKFLLENVAEAYDYLNHEQTFDRIIEAKFQEAWAIRNKM